MRCEQSRNTAFPLVLFHKDLFFPNLVFFVFFFYSKFPFKNYKNTMCASLTTETI